MADKPLKTGGAHRSGGSSAKARRAAARLAAVQALYQIKLIGEPVESVVAEFVTYRLGQEIDGDVYVAADPQLFSDIVRGASARKVDVEDLVTGALDSGFTFSRLELLLRSILLAGTYELLAHADSHPRILISAYVDITHAFYDGREPGVVNAVLDRVAHSVRPESFDETGGNG